MRITDLLLHPIAIADPPLRSSYGLHAPFALRTIVELKTDSGLTGIAETYGGEGPLAGLEAIRPRVIGMDPFQLAGLWHRGGLGRSPFHGPTVEKVPSGLAERTQTYLVPGENPLDRHARTFAAIEIACLDLIGKAVGKPVCDLSSAGACATPSASPPISFTSMAAEAGWGTTPGPTNTARCSTRAPRPRMPSDDRSSTASARSSSRAACSMPDLEIAHHSGTAPGIRRHLPAAHRPQLRLERGYLRARRP